MTKLEQEFDDLFADRFVRDKFDGYDMKMFKSLPEKEQIYLLDFIKDSCAVQRSNRDSFVLVNTDQRKEAWRDRKRFYRNLSAKGAHVEYIAGSDYDIDDSNNPEFLATIQEIREQKLTKPKKNRK